MSVITTQEFAPSIEVTGNSTRSHENVHPMLSETIWMCFVFSRACFTILASLHMGQKYRVVIPLIRFAPSMQLWSIVAFILSAPKCPSRLWVVMASSKRVPTRAHFINGNLTSISQCSPPTPLPQFVNPHRPSSIFLSLSAKHDKLVICQAHIFTSDVALIWTAVPHA